WCASPAAAVSSGKSSRKSARRSISAIITAMTRPSARRPAGSRASTWKRGFAAPSPITGPTPSITSEGQPTMIPQTDPKAAYLAHKAEIDAAIARVLESGRYILGSEVEAFEQEFASFAGVRHAVAVASGTDALILALRALGVGEGDAVVTVSHTAVATVAAVEL